MVIIESILLIGALGYVAHNLHERQQVARAQFGVKPPHKDHQKKQWRGLPIIPKTGGDVVRCLRGYTGPIDGGYPRAVIDKYIEYKRSRGTRDSDLCIKLDALEKQLVKFAPVFHRVREDYRLPESTVLPPDPNSRRGSRMSDVSDQLRPSISISPSEAAAWGSSSRRSVDGKLSPAGTGTGAGSPTKGAKGEIPPPYTADDEVRAHRMEVWNGQAVSREGTV